MRSRKHFNVRRPTKSLSHKLTLANLDLIAPFSFSVSQTTKACIARCARNVITTPKIVVTSDNAAVAGVGNLDMELASVGKPDGSGQSRTSSEPIDPFRRKRRVRQRLISQ